MLCRPIRLLEGIQLQFMAGHGFGEEDRAGGTKAVVVCASVARKLFGTTDAVGQQLLLNREPARVIGVVKDVSLQYAIALFIILLVPSLNLCGLSNSRMQQRTSELGYVRPSEERAVY